MHIKASMYNNWNEIHASSICISKGNSVTFKANVFIPKLVYDTLYKLHQFTSKCFVLFHPEFYDRHLRV